MYYSARTAREGGREGGREEGVMVATVKILRQSQSVPFGGKEHSLLSSVPPARRGSERAMWRAYRATDAV